MFFGVARHNGRSHNAAIEHDSPLQGTAGDEVLHGRRVADQQVGSGPFADAPGCERTESAYRSVIPAPRRAVSRIMSDDPSAPPAAELN
jgi:hypothetical protein